MEGEYLFTSVAFFILLFLILKFVFSKHENTRNLPPSPPGLPIIGHLHLLKEPVHRTLHELSKKFGHVFFLQLGTRKVVVVSSPLAVEECFTKNDITFANRPNVLAAKILNYESTTVLFAPYGDYWRNLRRLISLEMVSASRLAMFTSIWQEEVGHLLKQLFNKSGGQLVMVDLKSKLLEMSFNILMRMITGKRYFGEDDVDEEARKFWEIMSEVVEVHANSNLGDFLPVFQWVDVQGVAKRMLRLRKKMDEFFQHLLDEHRKMTSNELSPSLDASDWGNKERKSTFIDVMLSLQETEPLLYSDETIKGLVQVYIMEAKKSQHKFTRSESVKRSLERSETSTIVMEWAMSLLLNHPEAMNKAFAEINTHIGQDHLLEEQDLSKLSYLQNIINETLRLFPPAPFLLPHESSDDCVLCGFKIPRGTMLLVNLWSIHRNPQLWTDSTKFMPERFETGEDEGYKLIPFGTGRRVCPGASMAKRVMELTLGALIQAFEWERVGVEEIDLTGGICFSMTKAKPLQALCKPRRATAKLLSKV